MLLAWCLLASVVPVAAQPGGADLAGLLRDAQLVFDRGDYRRAQGLAEQALARAEQVQADQGLAVAQALLLLASAQAGQEQLGLALELRQRALAIREAALGPRHPDVALSLVQLGTSHVALAQFDQAVLHLQRAVGISEESLGPDHPTTALALGQLGMAHLHVGRHALALSLSQRALAINEQALGPDHPGTALAVEGVTRALGQLGQYAESVVAGQRALAIRERAQGADHPDLTTTLAHLSHAHSRLGQHDQALALRLRALAIQERAIGPDLPNTAHSLGNLAQTHVALGQRDQALPLQLRAVAIFERTLGPLHRDTAGALMNLAATYGALAQHDTALPLQQRALRIYEQRLGPDHATTAQSLNNLAYTYARLGQHDKAVPLRRRVLAVNAQALGADHAFTAIALSNLAQSLAALQQLDEALSLQRRALASREKALGPMHPATASSLHSLAQMHLALGQPDLALPLQLRALAIRERALGPVHPETAISLASLGMLHLALDQPDQALPLLQRSFAIHEQVFGTQHPSTALTLSQLALLHLALGDRPFAIALLKQSVNALQTMRERVAGIGQAELRSYTDTVAFTYQRLAEALTDEGRLPEAQLVLDMLKEDEQFDFIRRSPGDNPGRTRIGYNTVEQGWSERYRQIAGQLAALGAEAQALAKAAGAKPGLNAAQQQRQQAVAADLAVAQAAFGSFLGGMREDFARRGAARQVELAESSVQALGELRALLQGLGDGAVLLQIYLTDDRVNLLLTSPGVQLARSSTVSAQALNRQIAQFRRQLRDPASDPLPLAQALYQLLVAPVSQDLAQAGAKTVMLSLDGALRYLPFGALHDGQRYLVQRWALPVYTSVTRARLRDAVAPQWQAAGLGLTRQHGEFAPLPGVRAEMAGIIRGAVQPGQPGGEGALPGEVHLDEAFTAQRLKDVSQRRFPVLHVASHFRFSPGTEANSFLLLGDGQQLSLGELRAQNYRFDQVDLLTLSACDTALGGGRDERGREIEGFGVIAQQQGAKAVLATLWPVADQSTASLMADTYRRRQERQLSKIEALRQAQIALQAQGRYSHPFYWAPFILMGNWL